MWEEQGQREEKGAGRKMISSQYHGPASVKTRDSAIWCRKLDLRLKLLFFTLFGSNKEQT
jgi:hypothetical protein